MVTMAVEQSKLGNGDSFLALKASKASSPGYVSSLQVQKLPSPSKKSSQDVIIRDVVFHAHAILQLYIVF